VLTTFCFFYIHIRRTMPPTMPWFAPMALSTRPARGNILSCPTSCSISNDRIVDRPDTERQRRSILTIDARVIIIEDDDEVKIKVENEMSDSEASSVTLSSRPTYVHSSDKFLFDHTLTSPSPSPAPDQAKYVQCTLAGLTFDL
jgi:hypothetical protein